MNIAEYLSSSHPDDQQCRLSIAHAVRTLEQQQSQVQLQLNMKLFVIWCQISIPTLLTES